MITDRRLFAWISWLAVSACATPPPLHEPGPVVTLLGVSVPERPEGFAAFWARRTEDAGRGVTFVYTPPFDAEPGVTMRVYPLPDSADATYVRDQLQAELEERVRSQSAGPQLRVEPARAITVIGSDGASYEGWASSTGTPGSRQLSHTFVFEKLRHVVHYRFQDDGLDPVVTEAGAREFIGATIGGLTIRPSPRVESAPTRSAPRPAAGPVIRTPPLPAPHEGAPDDVREAVARWAFENAETDLAPPSAYCMEVSRADGAAGGDPDAAFLRRFDDLDVPVRPISQCYVLAAGPPVSALTRHSVVDPTTGRFALYFRLFLVEFTSPSSANLGVTYMQGGTWGGGWQCTVVAAGPGGWRVGECRRTVDR